MINLLICRLNGGQNAGFMSGAGNKKWSTRLYVDRIGYMCEKNVEGI